MIEPSTRKPGRPRDIDTQEAILEATRSILLDKGYHRLTFEGVAKAAATTRSTVYRWWPTRGSLVLEAAADQIDIGEVPDTGDSRTDIRAAIRQLIETFSDPLAKIVIMAAVANLDGDLHMASQFRENTVYPWRSTAAAALVRAQDRGDLAPDVDPGFLLNVVVGTVFQCTIVPAAPMIDGLEDRLVDLVLPPTS
jgi:AcrR family transcriptional regulator